LTRNGIAEDEQQSQLRFAWARSQEWLEWIEDRKKGLPQLPADDVTPYLDVIELYRRGRYCETTHFDQLTRNGIAEDEQQSQLRFAWARSHKFKA
jgi:hypothetical protein